MVYPKSRLQTYKTARAEKKTNKMENVLTEEFRQKRDEIIVEFDKMFAMHGNPTPKDSLQIEQQLFESAKTQVEYLILARRLLRTVLEMSQLRQDREERATASSSTTTSTPSLDRLPVGVDDAPQDKPEEKSLSTVEPQSPSDAQTDATVSSVNLSDMGADCSEDVKAVKVPVSVMKTRSRKGLAGLNRPVKYSLVALSLTGQRHVAVPEDAGSKRKRADTGSESTMQDSTRKDTVQVETRVLGVERSEEVASSDETVVTTETYRSMMTFIVPRGYRMRNVLVALEKVPVV